MESTLSQLSGADLVRQGLDRLEAERAEREARERQKHAHGSIGAVIAAVEAVPGVHNCWIEENATSEERRGVPAHGVRINIAADPELDAELVADALDQALPVWLKCAGANEARGYRFELWLREAQGARL